MKTISPSIPNPSEIPEHSKAWLNRFEKLIEEIPIATGFNNEELAEKLILSERHLFRKVRELREQAMGYTNVGYFIRQFKKEFGLKPLQVLQENGWH